MPDSVAVHEDITNLAQFVARAARERPDHVALISDHGSASWVELGDRVAAVAAGLRGLGLTPGDRVAVALPNSIEWATGFFGALAADLVAVPLNPAYTSAELTRLLADSGARVLLGSPEVHEATSALDTPGHRYVVGGTHPSARPYDELAATPGERTEPQRGGDDLAALLYTSGTSGRPRAAMLSHRALIANTAQLADLRPPPLGPDDVVLLALPLFHAFGLGPGLLAIARHAATGVLVDRFDAAVSLATIARSDVTTVLGVPAMYVAWSRQPEFADQFRAVRLAACGAAPLTAETRAALTEAGVDSPFEGYGLTETAPAVTSTLASPRPKPGSVGRPIPGVELRLVGADGLPMSTEDSENDENASPGTDPGEVWVRGDNLFSGYWPDGADGPDPEGWWPTGDIGYLDDDGDLFLVDRIGELILVSGFNVYPREVESALAGHPAVREAAVVGVPHELTGEAVKAFVVASGVSEEDLIEHCRTSLASFKCPVAVEFVERLPHSATGKVRKTALRTGDDG
ncbi:MAG: AMP-binding protein [Actinocatenispora sp.]